MEAFKKRVAFLLGYANITLRNALNALVCIKHLLSRVFIAFRCGLGCELYAEKTVAKPHFRPKPRMLS